LPARDGLCGPLQDEIKARARIRVLVKRILRRHGYPPDLQAAATDTVLQQAEVFAGAWG
jgi:type I restriction enzyme, R subunit